MNKKLSILTINVCAVILSITSIPLISLDVAQAGKNHQRSLKDTKDKDTKGKDTKGKDTKDKDTKGKDTKGKDTKDKDTKGKDTKDKDTKGKDTKGKDTKYKDTKGKDTKGKDTKGKDTKGKDTKGKDTKGKDTKGKDTKYKDTKGKDTKDKDTKGKDTKDKDTKGKDTKDKDTNDTQQETIDNLLNITTSGIWTSGEVDKVDWKGDVVGKNSLKNKHGLGTKEISWGTPFYQKSSSYVFEGVDTSLDVNNLDGKDFLLGTFTHNNYPISDEILTEANLAINLDIGDSSQAFDLTFEHNETLNGKWNKKKTEFTAYDVDDIVSIPSVDSTELLEIDGEMYRLIVSGFYQNGHLTDKFMTKENKSNSAKIYGRLRRVPEPAAGLGLLAIGAIGTFKIKKKTDAAE